LTFDADRGTLHADDPREVSMTTRITQAVLSSAALAAALLLVAPFVLGACSGARGGAAAQNGAARPATTSDAAGNTFAAGSADGGGAAASEPFAAAPAPQKPTGPAIVITWEALAREKYLLENSRFRRRGPQPPQKIVLVSSSHPDAAALASGRGQQKDSTVSTAILSDKDILGFVQGLKRSGFFKYARPAGYDTALVGSDDARGRVTVTQGTDSRSLLSIRGQGLNDKTKEIPALYSEAKQAIMALRNMTPTLNVTRSGATSRVNVR
jgi:hypothetical protein